MADTFFEEIHEMRKGLWAFSSRWCSLDADWLRSQVPITRASIELCDKLYELIKLACTRKLYFCIIICLWTFMRGLVLGGWASYKLQLILVHPCMHAVIRLHQLLITDYIND